MIQFINEELTWDSAKEILKNKIILLERTTRLGLAVGFELNCWAFFFKFLKLYCELKDQELASPINDLENDAFRNLAVANGALIFWLGYSAPDGSILYRDINGATAYQNRV